jgi:transcriptional regulator with XRE-family HTH domain
MEQNGDAIVVQMPDGSLVQYDTGGPEGIPYTQEQKDKFISDIKSDETIWFDEQGRRNWKALLEGDQVNSKEIYERRMAGESLQEVADSLGLTREQVRRIESEYARSNPPAAEFDYASAKAIALDESKSGQERYAALFDGARGEKLSDYIEKIGVDAEEFDPSTPMDAEVVLFIENGDGLVLRYPDGAYYWVETGSVNADTGLLTPTNVNEYDGEVNNKNFKDYFDAESGLFAFGGIIDEQRQNALEDGVANEGEGDGGPDEPPSRPTGGGNPGSGFTDYVIDLAEDNSDLGKDLEERLDDDATDVGAELMDQIYDDASRRYELSQDIADNKPEGMSDDEFVRDAVAKMREQLSSIVDSAIDERRAFEDDEELEVDFDKKAFIDAGAKRFEELLREELDNMGEDDEGSDEPPSPGGGTPPKVPSPSTPGSPALFEDFDKPAGAYQLRTTEYEPEGRIDEASTDFTDDPRRLATKFSLDDLVTAFTEALIGRPDEAAMQDILNANVDDNDDLPDLADLADVAESNAPRATANNASGAGALEFNAGEEYVLAEALYNAVYEAGGDPNRVIANAYDAVNGNRNNAQKLLDAQGGVSSPEEIQLIEDITDEIRQIKDVTPDDEIDAVNKRTTPEKKFAGSLIENVPVDYNNPDYFDMDTDAYIPAQPETDENGYTDNPEILALDYESADLIEQMLEGITDGSGVALLDFGGEDGVHEVPVEALRDAIQLQDINTNEILFKLRDESNDMSEEPTTEPEAPRLAREDIRWDEQKGLYTDVNGKILDGDTVDAAGLDSSLRDGRDADIQLLRPAAEQPQEEAPAQAPSSTRAFTPFLDAFEEDSETSDMLSDLAELDKAANAAVNFFSTGLSGARFIGFNPEKGSIAIITPENRGEAPRAVIANADGQVTNMATMTPADAIQFMSDVGPMFGWQPIPQRVADSIISENILLFPESNQPSVDATPEAPATEATAPTPAFAYPGPREAGYTANNTTLASDGSIIGAGSIVVANRDGKRGVVLSIQNDPEYARIRFEDGKVAVRSANQIKAVSNPDGTLAMLPSGAAAPSGATPSTDVESRLEAPVRQAPNIARSGAAWGVNDTTDIPDYIKPLVRENVAQSDFAAWGSRDAEIMNAATNRASLDSLLALIDKYETARANGEDAAVLRAIKDETGKALIDVYGGRDGVSFGVDGFAVNVVSSSSSVNSRAQADGRTAKSYSLRVGFYLKDKNGREVGEGSRTITIEDSTDENGNAVRNSYVKNDILKVYGANKKKGFASAYNRYMENWYIANGIDKVKVMAAGGGGSWQGAFVWALNGFDWENADAARGMIRSLGFAAKTPEEKAIAKKLADKADAASGDVTKVPTPLEVALAGWYPGAKKWFGKDVIIERSWNGVKHLNPTAREQIQSINYGQIKNAERRIQAGQNKPGLSAVGLAHVMDNSFQTGNPELGPYIEQIRDVLRNNRSLASLSPAAKSVLNAFTSKEMLNKDSSMPIEDIFRLRTALMSEYRAENDYANPFGALERALSEVKMQTSRSTTTLDMSALRAAGFKAQALTGDDSGVNDTFRVVHEPSGQVFFIKKEQLSRSWNSARGLTSEVEANTIMNALEMLGIQSVRGSSKDSDVIVMSQAGASLPLAAPAENASKMMTRGIKDANGNVFVGGDSGKFLDVLKNPEDIINMAIVDMLGAGQDRHDSNWMAAFDSTDNRMVMFPIDNALLTVDKTESGIEDFFISTWPDTGEVYNQVMPRFIKNAGEDRAAEIFMNQVRKLVKNLDNPLFQPKGEELAALIDKWGSYDAFKDALKTRLTTIVTPGSAENKALINSMKMSYWR